MAMRPEQLDCEKRREFVDAEAQYVPYLRGLGKKCTKCGIVRSANFFYPKRYGDTKCLSSWCKSCTSIRKKTTHARKTSERYYKKNRDIILAKRREEYAKKRDTHPGFMEYKRARDNAWSYRKSLEVAAKRPRKPVGFYREAVRVIESLMLDGRVAGRGEVRSYIFNLLKYNPKFLEASNITGERIKVCWLTTRGREGDGILLYGKHAHEMDYIINASKMTKDRAQRQVRLIRELLHIGVELRTIAGELVTPDFLQKKAQEVGDFLGQKL